MSAQKRTPVNRESKKEKVVEHGLVSNKEIRTVELKSHQKPVSNFLRQNDVSVLIADAGCAKDFVQMYRAIEGLKTKEFERIIICKPIIEAGGISIGFLPGSIEEKTSVYLKSFYDSVDKIVGKDHSNPIKAKMQFEHVGFQRGNTFPEYSIIILSELQNLTASQAHTYITRLPQTSKMFISADSSQSDLGMKSGLNDFLESISGIENYGIALLDGEKHQMRRKEVIQITKKYNEIQKRKGNFFTLDKSRFEYIEL